MGTKATINYLRADGKVERIWVTHDGYLDHVGNLLLNHYNTPEKIEALMERGTPPLWGKL